MCRDLLLLKFLLPFPFSISNVGLFLQLLPTKPFPLFRNVVQLRRFEFPIRIRSILRQISGPFFFAKKFSFSADNLQKYSLKKKKKRNRKRILYKL